ncbi:zinc finger MYM-type protein 1-like isoform X2 [Acanthochromis polyacanthus]|uniref:zinc finger MYM-type protein 1-like isoform X2 n=1 Tax=Acanthochromis polyacanthus TaxID=80966 RepID=UPI00223489AE|nr:zinc finger MYM-type protein 1-like isoform X2 [Acanthochromis polyacanthus]
MSSVQDPQITQHTMDFQQKYVSTEGEVLAEQELSNQGRIFSLDEEGPNIQQIKEEQEDLCSTLKQTDSVPLQIKEEQKELCSIMDQEEPDPQPIKEEQEDLCSSMDQEDRDPPHIKEEQEECCNSQEEQHVGLKLQTVIFKVTPTYEEVDHSEPESNGNGRCLILEKIERENSVKSLKTTPFERRTLQEKLRVKELGPDRPDVLIRQQSKDRGRRYTRSFSRAWYEKTSWLTGCSEAGALFCFPCLLFQTKGTDQAWIQTGMVDLKHLSEKVRRHEQARSHMENAMRLGMFGRANIAAQLDDGYRIGIRKHNEEVDKNRHVLSKIIDCIKFCGAFELALRGHDESESSENPGVFRGLVDFVASLDAAVHEHLQTATVFKGTSKTVQNELLDCMLAVLRESIIEEVQCADFISIQADETMDISTQCQLVLVIRYIDKMNEVQERFFEFIPLQSATAESIATALLERLSLILPDDQKSKLISQAYDGASVMRGATGGVQKKVSDVYANAHYVHCYAHQLNIIMQQVTSRIPKVGQFFSDLAGFSGFFSRSPKRTSVLDRVVAHRIPRAGTVRWNFHSRAVNTVFEHKDDLLQCFETIRDSGDFDPTTVREAGGFVRLLEDATFCFFLELFHRIMPHVDMLYSQLQKRSIDSVFVHRVMQHFTDNVQMIRDSLPTVSEEHHSCVPQQPLAKKRRTLGPDELQRIATEVCDTILGHAKERFAFTKHLISATLLQGDRFQEYNGQFPEAALNTTMEAYPMLNKCKLKTELSLIFSSTQFRSCNGAVALYQLFMSNNLQDTFSETVSLLKILITTPMTTAESERCFSTLKRIKTFLRNTMSQDRLNALAMLSMEKKLVRETPDFNHRVIEKCSCLKDRRAKLAYKK